MATKHDLGQSEMTMRSADRGVAVTARSSASTTGRGGGRETNSKKSLAPHAAGGQRRSKAMARSVGGLVLGACTPRHASLVLGLRDATPSTSARNVAALCNMSYQTISPAARGLEAFSPAPWGRLTGKRFAAKYAVVVFGLRIVWIMPGTGWGHGGELEKAQWILTSIPAVVAIRGRSTAQGQYRNRREPRPPASSAPG